MSKNKVISITDMTQKAYDCILQQNYTKRPASNIGIAA